MSKKLEQALQTSFRTLEYKTFINLLYTVNQLSYNFFRLLRAHGLSPAQYNVLRILRGAKRKVSLRYIKERMLEPCSDVSRIIARLEKRGLITKTTNTKDKRQCAVSITKKGLQLLEAIDPCEREIENYLRWLTREELEQLNHLLDRIRDIMPSIKTAVVREVG